MTPGIHVKVVNSYAADRDSVSVIEDKRVDLPTEGNPIIQTLALPNLLTSNPYPFAPLPVGYSSCVRYLASLALS